MQKGMILLLLVMMCASCMSQKQGIAGRVVWLSGNQMPGPDNKNKPAEGISREIYIYEPATLEDVKRSDGFFTEVRTPLVAKVESNDDGAFKINLPPGEYSVFTKEPQGLWANIFDGQGRINVIEVKPNDFTKTTLQVNYKAAF